MQLDELVGACEHARACDARLDKVNRLVELLRRCTTDEVAIVTTLLLRTDLFEQGARSEVEPERAPGSRDELSITEIADALAEIDAASTEAVRQMLRDQLANRVLPTHRAWIVAVAEHSSVDPSTFGVVTSAAARTARVPVGRLRRAATLCGSLPLAVRIALEHGADGLDDVAIRPGRPVPLTRIEGDEQIDATQKLSEPHVIEWRPAGQRIQAHRTNGVVAVFDERLRDVTAATAGVVQQVAGFPHGDLVLDGWASFGRSTSDPGDAWTRRTNAGIGVFADVLFDGVQVVDEPLEDRRRRLADIVPPEAMAPQYDPDDLRDVVAAVRRVHDHPGSELVLKAYDAPYEGGLVRSTWRRIADGRIAMLAAVAAERGSGSRSHLLPTVHLAAAAGTELVTVCRTSRIVTDDMVVEQTGAFANLALDGDDDDVFRLRPHLVAAVAIDGAEPDDSTPDGIRVSRPRVLGYLRRADAQLTTLAELRKLCLGAAPSRLDTGGDAAAPFLPPAVPAPEPIGDDAYSLSVASVPTTAPARSSGLDLDFAPYREPPMVTSSWPWIAVVASRAIAAAWAIAALAAAYVLRSSDERTGDQVDLTGRAGIAVVILLSIAGWVWSDQVVRNLQRLDGKRPNRMRCVTTWLTPMVVAGALTVLVVPLEPTQPADIRPIVIGAVFVMTMWRPYSLIRRMLTTLTRERSDSLLASAYIVDVLAFGLVWWRFTAWPSDADQLTDGVVDTMVAGLGAVALLLVVATVLWVQILRAVRRALAYRRSSQATRYEHRMLRLRGIDVKDPEVWWALVQRRADERRAKERLAASADTVLVRGDMTVDELVAHTRHEHSTAFRRLGSAESEELERRLRTEFAAILNDDDLLEQRRDDEARPEPGPPAGPEREPQPVAARARDDGTEDMFERQLQTLIRRAGTAQVDAALDAHRRRLDDDPDAIRTVPPRLVPLEAARLLMGLGFAIVTFAAAWLSVAALRAGQLDTGTGMSVSTVDQLELARRVFWLAAVAGCVLVTLWVSTTLRPAGRANAPVPSARRIDTFVVVGAVLGGAAIYLERADPGALTVLTLVPLTWAAISSGLSLEPTRTWFHLPSAPLTSWLVMLPALTVVGFLGGLVSPIELDSSPQRIAFAGILLTLGSARITALSVLTSIDLEDELRSSPELAVPVR